MGEKILYPRDLVELVKEKSYIMDTIETFGKLTHLTEIHPYTQTKEKFDKSDYEKGAVLGRLEVVGAVEFGEVIPFRFRVRHEFDNWSYEEEKITESYLKEVQDISLAVYLRFMGALKSPSPSLSLTGSVTMDKHRFLFIPSNINVHTGDGIIGHGYEHCYEGFRTKEDKR